MPETTGAETIRWDLTDLYADTTALDADLARASEETDAFAERYRGCVGTMGAGELAEALQAYEALHDRLGRAYTYAHLAWSTATTHPERGALLQRVREAYTDASQRLLFFDLEWLALGDDRAGELLDAPALAGYRHYLEVERLSKPFVLDEQAEQVMSSKRVTGRSAWTRYFDETLGSARFDLRGESLSQQQVLAKLYEPDRDLRRAATLAFTDGLEEHARTLTFVYNTVLADKAADDRLRGYPHWLRSRNLSNEVPDETVDALVEAVTSRYDLVQRFYALKKTLLGVERLRDYDRYAPVGETSVTYTWDEARAIVTESYAAFSPVLGDIVERFFAERWIDAALAPGKRGGAFSHGAVPSAHPYILVNYTGTIRDVQTLAHELGHGVHQYLSREQGALQADTPLTTAETASVFGEMLVFQRLLTGLSDPKERLALIVSKLDDSIATVFRQVAMNRFEDRIHTARRESGELSQDDFATHWIETQTAMMGDSVELGEHYRRWWSYIPHFLHTPGYVYAYAFGELLVLALYARYQQVGDDFVGQYLELLRAGGSDYPHVLVGHLGVDLTDLGFWHQGLAAIDALVSEAEALSA